MKLSILIPVYNEEKTIGLIIEKILALDFGGWEKEIIVINDGSTDNTPEIIKNYLKDKIIYLPQSKNGGKGVCVAAGLRMATGDYIIIQDADLEYEPNDIKKLLPIIITNPDTVVYGSRFLTDNEDTVFGHRTGNKVLTLATNILYHSNLTDMETCYKLIPLKIAIDLNIESRRFNLEPELTAKILRRGIHIIEVPIRYEKRGYTEGKKIHWFKDGLSAVFTLIKYY